jgi:MFS family permease
MELVLIGGSQYFKAVSDALSGAEPGSVPVSQVALLMTFITMTISVCAPIAGRLFPKIDSRILLTVMGLMVFGGYALMSIYTEVWMWWISGVIIGAGVAGIGIIGAPIFIANWFDKRTGTALGIYGFVLAGLSFIIQPLIAVVIKEVGYQSAYLIWAVVCSVMYFPFALFVVKFKPEQIGLKPYGYGEDKTGEEKSDAAGPGVPFKKAIPTAAFILLLLATGIMCNHGGFKSNWSNFAQSAWGYDIVFGGFMLSATTASKFMNPFIGIAMDKLGAVKTCVATLCLIALGFVLLLFLNSIPAVVLVAVFFVGFESCNMKIVIPMLVRELFGTKEHSQIYSFMYGIINFLGAFATSLIAWSAEVGGSGDAAMIFGIGMTLLAILLLVGAKAASKKLVWED